MTERMCIATRTVRPIEQMVRFVAGPEGNVVPDVLCKLPGRGVWVSASRRCVEEAVRKNQFPRAFKTGVRAGADLADLVGAGLRRRALELLALAQKAGLVRCGTEKILENAAREAPVILLHACEASKGGTEKLVRRLHGVVKDGAGFDELNMFSSEELSLALGRSNVVHAALTDGTLTRRFSDAARKYDAYGDEFADSSSRAPLTAARMESR